MGYSIYGAGATSDNRIIVKVACGEPAIIPYIVKYEGNDSCNPVTEFYNYSREVDPITDCDCGSKPASSCNDWVVKKTKEGSFIGEHNLEVYYEIISELDCHKDPDCETGCTIGNYWVKKGEGNNITVNYELFKFKDCDTVIKEIKTAAAQCTSDVIEINTDCGKFFINYECQTGCTDPGSTTVNIRGISLNPTAVEYTGGTVYATISYEIIVKDEECNEKKTRGSFIITVDAPNCDDICDCENSLRIVTRDDDAPNELCCVDHNIDVNISKNDILSKLGLSGDDIKVIYKNKQIGESLTVSILQKADPNPDCDKDCDYKTTYCVLEYPISTDDTAHTIDVDYETYWGSRDWSGKEVPPYGGRVKVSFDYLATATPIDSEGREIIGDKKCKPYSFNGSDSVIIEVPPCEEIKEEDIIPGIILYKEQTYGCAFPSQDIEGITMNMISYSVKQACTGTCEPIEYKKYTPLKIEELVDKCASTLTGKVPYTLIKIDKDCNKTETTGGEEEITIQISPNQTNSPITVVNEYFIYTQEAGPCKEGQTCDCEEALTIINKDIPDPPGPTPPGPTPPTPTDCDVTADSKLDGYVSEFSEALGTTINADNSPCTYKYLKEAYSAVSGKNSTTITWMIANVLSELTPEVGKVTEYFEVATEKSSGIKDLVEEEELYNSRMAGGVEYARWKHNDFSIKNAMATNARTELSAKGISEAKLIYVPNEFVRGEVINPTNIVPNMGGQVTLGQINTSDITAMSKILTDYPDEQTIKNSELGDNPFADKEYCSKRLCQILGISSSDDKYNNWLDFIDYAKDADDAAVNVIKRGIDGKLPPQYRLRPTGQIIKGKIANMVCGGEAEQAARDLCSDTDTCKSEYDRFIDETGSYPSGHSGRGYIAGLVYLQVKGEDKMDRMNQYCHNRAIVRAHWVSDTIAAKLITSTVIGFLNGVKNYLDKVSVLMGDTPTPPTDCICEEVKSKYSGPAATCSKSAKTKEYIGSGKTGENCGETIPNATRISIEEGSGAATTLESIKVEPQEGNVYFIYGDILENTSGALRKTRIYFDVKEKDSGGKITDESYINIYQAG